jgi:fatty-acyl-CoA synthase
MDTPSPGVRLSYAHGTSRTPLLGQTIGDNLRTTVEKFPDQDALVVCQQDFRATYGQLWAIVTRCARALLNLGVQPGECVGVWSTNCYEWVVVQYATARVGAILVNINPAYQVPELEYALNRSGVSVLFSGRGFRQNLYQPMLDEVTPHCLDLKHSLRFDEDWETFLQTADRVSEEELTVREQALQFDDPINIQYTSGTTGFPKGATLTHHNLVNNGFFVGQALGYSERDRVCIPVPFYHCFGMVLGNLACTSTGACMVIPSETFHPRAVLESVVAERCTSLYGVPTMFRAVLDDPELNRFDRFSLRTGIMAGAPCPIELMREVVDRLHMPEVAIGYGMTETSPISALTARDDSLERRVSTVGRVLPHVEICIRDPATRAVLPRGTAGEFCTRGTSVMRGYWNDEAATRAAISNGWMHSGDLAVMDEEGYVHIVGRLKDMIIRGGENIYPREVEAALHSHPAVNDVQVIGVPSHRYGEEVMAFVRLHSGISASADELRAYCQTRLASFKVPRYWEFVESFPMTVTGKVQKFRLREMAIERLGRQKDAGEETA